MKLLLTSAGIKNPSIQNALVNLLGKPIAESSALVIPTAIYAFPGGAGMAYQLLAGRAASPLCELGWKSLGLLELTALPSIKEEYGVPMVQETDALLVGGGDPLHLRDWMRQSGLADLLPSLSETVYVGVSGGSIVITRFGAIYDGQDSPTGFDGALGLVDFTLYAHLDHPAMPDASLVNIERWAAEVPVPTYAIDDETAIQVTDGSVKVISEGHWKLITPQTL